MAITTIQYNPRNTIVSSCLEFLSTLKGVKILQEAEYKEELSAKEEKDLFFTGSKKSMSKHFEKYL